MSVHLKCKVLTGYINFSPNVCVGLRGKVIYLLTALIAVQPRKSHYINSGRQLLEERAPYIYMRL